MDRIMSPYITAALADCKKESGENAFVKTTVKLAVHFAGLWVSRGTVSISTLSVRSS